MNLEEFRKSMESDATIENQKLKAEIEKLKKELHKERSDRSHEKAQLISDCRALTNRCHVLTQGAMCVFCELHGYVCDHAWSLDRKIAYAKEAMLEEQHDD